MPVPVGEVDQEVVDPEEDYAIHGDGPSADAVDLETVVEWVGEQQCLPPGSRGCQMDAQCCGASQCRAPAGQISGVFHCTS